MNACCKYFNTHNLSINKRRIGTQQNEFLFPFCLALCSRHRTDYHSTIGCFHLAQRKSNHSKTQRTNSKSILYRLPTPSNCAILSMGHQHSYSNSRCRSNSTQSIHTQTLYWKTQHPFWVQQRTKHTIYSRHHNFINIRGIIQPFSTYESNHSLFNYVCIISDFFYSLTLFTLKISCQTWKSMFINSLIAFYFNEI